MKRWIACAAALALALGAWLVLRGPVGLGRPLASLAPADALFYAEIASPAELDRLPRSWIDPVRARLEESKAHLAGPLAIYVDRDREWVALARLTRTATLLADTVMEGDVAVSAQSPAALRRHRERQGSLAESEAFRTLGSRAYVNLEALNLPGRLRDYSAAGFEIDPGPPLVVRGRALYRNGLFRLFLESYLHAPRPPAPAAGGPLSATLTEPFPRIWDEVIHGLMPLDREKVDRQASALSRDFLGGRGVREFLARVGPSGGLSVLPTPHGIPAIAGWIDLADDAARDTLAKMLHRTAHDIEAHARNRGQAPSWDVSVDGDLWRVKIADPALHRLGAGFAPAYAFRDRRLLFTTCAPVFATPPAAGVEGTHHTTVEIETGPFFQALRSFAPFLADGAFRAEAETRAAALFDRIYTPALLAPLKKRFPDPHDLNRHLRDQRVQLAATALSDLSKTPRYEEELRRTRAWMDDLEKLLGGIERAGFSGRFLDEGLQFELRLR